MRAIAMTIAVGAVVWSIPANAQGLDAERFVPAAGAAGGLMVERPAVARHLDWGLGLFLDLADDALVLTDRDTGDVVARPVDTALTANVFASIGLLDRAEVGLLLPAQLYYDGDTVAAGGEALSASAGVGDLRLVPKLLVVRSARLEVGAALPVTFPTGSETALRGDGGVTVEPRVLLGILRRRLSVFGNGGVRLRLQGDDLDPVGHELTFGVGAAYALSPSRDLADLLLEVNGAYDVSQSGDELTDLPLELLGGVAVAVRPDLHLYAGAGLGLTDGLGTPDARGLIGIRFAPRRAGGTPYQDSDNDGIADTADRCPDQPEDEDGFEDGDGCPEADNDGDGILDDDDECPDVPEEKGGDRDGCPEHGRVIVEDGKILIIGKVQFETGSADIKPKSQQLLDDVAIALNEHPEIARIEIQGHTDNVGGDDTNQKLSQKRAEAVRRALIDRKVEGGRLEARGYGESRPVAPNKTRGGRAKNRRVEFVAKE